MIDFLLGFAVAFHVFLIGTTVAGVFFPEVRTTIRVRDMLLVGCMACTFAILVAWSWYRYEPLIRGML